MYNLGTVGLGHWVKRLHEVLKQNQQIKLVKFYILLILMIRHGVIVLIVYV